MNSAALNRGELAGEVEIVATGERSLVRSTADLVEALQRSVEDETGDTPT